MEISYVPDTGDMNERRVCPVACSDIYLHVPSALFLSDADMNKIQQCREAAKIVKNLGLDIQSINVSYMPSLVFGHLDFGAEKHTFISDADDADYFRAESWSILTFMDGTSWIQCYEKSSGTLVEWLVKE